MMEPAVEETLSADIFIVIGTSLQVYPAAGLLEYVKESTPKFIIDPNMPSVSSRPNLFLIEEKGSVGMKEVRETLMAKYI